MLRTGSGYLVTVNADIDKDGEAMCREVSQTRRNRHQSLELYIMCETYV